MALSLACGSTGEKVVLDTSLPSPSPVAEFKIPTDFKEFDIGPFRLFGPPDLKKKNVQGIDSEIHEFENRDFAIGMDISPMLYGEEYELTDQSYQHETGTVVIDGRNVKYIKGDLNKSLPTAARNADGSRSPPEEKHHFVTVFIPQANAVVSVNYRNEASTGSVFAILQSIKVKQ
ncbi:MAG: hypothetical protein ABI539_08965 [Acidobacteriota bacterium]